MNVLILRLSALGDVAMTVPVIHSVARRYPDVKFTVVTRPFFRRLFLDVPPNVEFINFTARTAKELVAFIRSLSSKKFTAVADLHDMIRTRAIGMALRLRGCRVATVDKGRRKRRDLTVKKGREFQRSYIDRYADVFARLGYPVQVDFAGFANPKVKRSGVGIAPFARYETKTYPPELMEQVARRLTDRKIPVYLFGARGEEEKTLQGWVERNPRLTLMAGKLSIEEELQAMGRLKLMVSMDSANMHLASLMATPVVSIWGSTMPQCGFMGYGQKVKRAVCLELRCQPCSVAGRAECPLGTLVCLRGIDPEIIVDRVLTLYDR